jgi:hypothetical protein
MKTGLLLFTLSFTSLIFGQTAIEQFQSATDAQYNVLTGSIDQSASGADQSWDFTNLIPSDTFLEDTYTTTATTATIQTLENGEPLSRINLDTSGTELAITGLLSQGIVIDYSDNNAELGAFPLAFEYANTDAVEGVFVSTTITGDILPTSTIQTTVDAWGTLRVGTFDGAVTRLKVVQTLNLAVGGFPAGQGIQTSYLYYDANSTDLVFRTTHLNVPLASVDETVIETLSKFTLSRTEVVAPKVVFSVLENPVKNVLKLSLSHNIMLSAIRILDVSGRLVKHITNDDPFMNIGTLKSGTYIISADTNKGVLRSKFVKE